MFLALKSFKILNSITPRVLFLNVYYYWWNKFIHSYSNRTDTVFRSPISGLSLNYVKVLTKFNRTKNVVNLILFLPLQYLIRKPFFKYYRKQPTSADFDFKLTIKSVGISLDVSIKSSFQNKLWVPNQKQSSLIVICQST